MIPGTKIMFGKTEKTLFPVFPSDLRVVAGRVKTVKSDQMVSKGVKKV